MTTNTDSTTLGNLYRYRHQGWQNGSRDWGEGRRLVGKGGWQSYKSVFATSDGVMYAVDNNGNLYWYKHEGWQTGDGKLGAGKLVGEGGWQQYANVFATSDGVMFAVDNNVASSIKQSSI
jgi:hypothetical protein